MRTILFIFLGALWAIMVVFTGSIWKGLALGLSAAVPFLMFFIFDDRRVAFGWWLYVFRVGTTLHLHERFPAPYRDLRLPWDPTPSAGTPDDRITGSIIALPVEGSLRLRRSAVEYTTMGKQKRPSVGSLNSDGTVNVGRLPHVPLDQLEWVMARDGIGVEDLWRERRWLEGIADALGRALFGLEHYLESELAKIKQRRNKPPRTSLTCLRLIRLVRAEVAAQARLSASTPWTDWQRQAEDWLRVRRARLAAEREGPTERSNA